MSYEIQKVANGYIVRPAYNPSTSGSFARLDTDIFVFATVALAAEWLAEKFGEARNG